MKTVEFIVWTIWLTKEIYKGIWSLWNLA